MEIRLHLRRGGAFFTDAPEQRFHLGGRERVGGRDGGECAEEEDEREKLFLDIFGLWNARPKGFFAPGLWFSRRCGR